MLDIFRRLLSGVSCSHVFSFALSVFASSRVVSFFLFFSSPARRPCPAIFHNYAALWATIKIRGACRSHDGRPAWIFITVANGWFERARRARLIPRRGSTSSRAAFSSGWRKERSVDRAICRVAGLHVSPDMRNLDYQAGPLHYLHSETATSLTNCHYTHRPTGLPARRDYSPFCHQRTMYYRAATFRKIWNGVYSAESKFTSYIATLPSHYNLAPCTECMN